MLYFRGTYYHQLDAKNRIRIPAKLKKALGDNYCFTKGTNGCIFAFPEEVIEKKIEALQDVKISDEEKQKGLRIFMKGIISAEEDNQGRIVLDKTLRTFAKIKKDIVFCGANGRIDIWAKEVYDEYFKDEDDNYDLFLKMLDI